MYDSDHGSVANRDNQATNKSFPSSFHYVNFDRIYTLKKIHKRIEISTDINFHIGKNHF